MALLCDILILLFVQVHAIITFTMWGQIRKHRILTVILVTVLLVLMTNGGLLKALMIVLFTGGIPSTDLAIPAPIMLLGWAAAGIGFLLWTGRKMTVSRLSAPVTGQAYYYRTTAKKSLHGRAVTRKRAVSRRYAKIES